MKKDLIYKQWSWKTSGIALGIMFFLAVLMVKPIGVSTQFVIANGVAWNLASDIVIEDSTSKSGYSSTNEYLNKSGGKYAESIANPINYSFIFVIAMIGGGFISSKLQGEKQPKNDLLAPPIWRKNFGSSKGKRYMISFLGGVLVLFGARLAGGCTSGHMMSGMMQTSLSGYLFSLGTFVVAIPVALLLYKKEG